MIVRFPAGARSPEVWGRLLLFLAWLLPVVVMHSAPGPQKPPPLFALSRGKGDFWHSRETEREWSCVACSADARILVAGVEGGRLYLSTNFGVTWSPRDEARRWRAIAASADGRRFAAAVDSGRLYVSSDAGETWEGRETPRKWSAIASNADGTHLVATVEGGHIFVSADAGNTWEARASTDDWRGVSSSPDGLHLAAVPFMGRIHTSTNAGLTWSPHGFLGGWIDIATSADGRCLAAAEWNGYIHVSTNAGVSWIQVDSNPGLTAGKSRCWRSVRCSLDGSVISAVDWVDPNHDRDEASQAGYAFSSDNGGESWEMHGPRKQWSAIASSADGRRLVAVARGGNVFTLERTTSRRSVLASTNSGVVSLRRFAIPFVNPYGTAGGTTPPPRFQVIPNDPGLFELPPAIASDGTLTFSTGSREGFALVSVVAQLGDADNPSGIPSGDPQTFLLEVQSRAFQSSQWTDEASTGLARDATLWAWRTGSPAESDAVINGVPTPLAPGPQFESPGQFTLVGPNSVNTYPTEVPLTITGSSRNTIAKSYVDRGDHAVIRLEHLLPGRPYTLHVLGRPRRAVYDTRATWSAPGGRVDLMENEFGDERGTRISHRFVPTGESYEIRVMPSGLESWAFCALALNSVPARSLIESPEGARQARGSQFDAGTVPIGLGLRLAFTLRNEGVVPLKDLKLIVDGPHAGDFVAIPPATPTVPGEGSGTFQVEFRPSATGARRATLRIESNEPEPFLLHLNGTGQSETQIAVTELPDQAIDEDHATGPVPLVVGEPLAGREVAVAGSSSDSNLVPAGNIVFEGSGSFRRVIVKPRENGFGTAVVQVLASDGRQSRRGRFTLSVRPVNDPPRFSLPAGAITNAGTDWTARGPSHPWQALASSHDGRRLVAAATGGRLHLSTNAGVSWTEQELARPWIAVASSADGVRLAAAAVDGPLLTSSDSGATWVERVGRRSWAGLASSANGMRLAAVVDGGQVHTSTNGGVTWTARDRARLWRGIASSADGMRLAAIVSDGPIQISTDGGESWTPRSNPHPWTSITSSADGSQLGAATWDGPVFLSRDSGTTWTARTQERFWRTLSCSADGSRWIAGETLGGLHVSLDSGTTWTRRGVNGDWNSAVWSADGDRVAAVAFGGPVATSATRMAPHRLAVNARTGATTLPGFVRGISAGPNDEVNQRIHWNLTCAEPDLFTIAPSISEDGSLSFVPKGQAGLVHLTLVARDDGGTERGGSDTSEPQQFEIELRTP